MLRGPRQARSAPPTPSLLALGPRCPRPFRRPSCFFTETPAEHGEAHLGRLLDAGPWGPGPGRPARSGLEGHTPDPAESAGRPRTVTPKHVAQPLPRRARRGRSVVHTANAGVWTTRVTTRATGLPQGGSANRAVSRSVWPQAGVRACVCVHVCAHSPPPCCVCLCVCACARASTHPWQAALTGPDTCGRSRSAPRAGSGGPPVSRPCFSP